MNCYPNAVLERSKKNLAFNCTTANQQDFKPKRQKGGVFFLVFLLTKRFRGESLSAKGILCLLGSAWSAELTHFGASSEEPFGNVHNSTRLFSLGSTFTTLQRQLKLYQKKKNPCTGCNQPQICRETLTNCLQVPRKTTVVYNELFPMSSQLNPNETCFSKRK